MLVICTLNDATLAKGASVPTTNADPVWVFDWLPVEIMLPLPQPAATNAAAVMESSASL